MRNLLTEWRKLGLPKNGGVLVAAISGGADSVSLLLALHELRKQKKLDCRIVAAHFNHNLRGSESDEDEKFVKNLASRLEVELALGRAENFSEKGNLEQNARVARYEFLFETATNLDASAILTAHTLNDQAETFLINLIRGSGIEGLGGMKSVKILNSEIYNNESGKTSDSDDRSEIRNLKSKIQLVRPLLSWAKREDTENFCRLNEIDFRNDSMNEDLAFSRVRIRKILLPMLKDFNPKIIETIAQTAQLLRDDAEFLQSKKNIQKSEDNQSDKIDDSETTENEELEDEKIEQGLALKELKDIFPSMRRLILREWLQNNRGNLRGLELKHIDAIEKLIFSRKSGKTVELPNGVTVTKKNGKLTFQNSKVEK